MAQSMMKAKGMLTRFSGEAMTTAVFILNRAPTKALKGRTSFEAWHGRKPSVSFLWTFGCIGHVRKMKSVLTKLEDRSTPMVFLGYAEGTKAYCGGINPYTLTARLGPTRTRGSSSLEGCARPS